MIEVYALLSALSSCLINLTLISSYEEVPASVCVSAVTAVCSLLPEGRANNATEKTQMVGCRPFPGTEAVREGTPSKLDALSLAWAHYRRTEQQPPWTPLFKPDVIHSATFPLIFTMGTVQLKDENNTFFTITAIY